MGGTNTNVDSLLLFPFGLRTYSPVEEEPEGQNSLQTGLSSNVGPPSNSRLPTPRTSMAAHPIPPRSTSHIANADQWDSISLDKGGRLKGMWSSAWS
ncbi:hypothetical protein BGY98DRAFT_537489 [Russula aff. rugulosa BPL654]|nr:hypothetical protein BGY98DRAFT_537489 [Russula aff. rugulosa BPL654]